LIKLTTEQYIQKANKVHNNKYIYPSPYYGLSKSITILCPAHGEFTKLASNHLQGYGCKECSKLNRKQRKDTHSKEKFLERAIEVHGEGRYDYSNSVYIHSRSKVDIHCTYCDTIFSVKPRDHIHNATGCPTCAKAIRGWGRSAYVELANKYGNKSKLYILKCFNDEEEFYKIGITMKTVKQRFPTKNYMPYKYETTLLLEGEAGQIWDLEKKLHKQFAELTYIPKRPFNGQTECFKGLSQEIITTLNKTI
jgi:hypothetical protein